MVINGSESSLVSEVIGKQDLFPFWHKLKASVHKQKENDGF